MDFGIGMAACGWALWNLTGSLDDYQALDLIRDGYRSWASTGASDALLLHQFIAEFFALYRALPRPTYPDDIWSAPREVITPISEFYGGLCWAANEYLDSVERNTPDQLPAARRDASEAIRASHPAFRPPRSAEWLAAVDQRADP